MTMLNTTLRNGLMLLGWLCLIFSVGPHRKITLVGGVVFDVMIGQHQKAIRRPGFIGLPNTTLRNGLMLLGWLCLIFSVRAEEVPFLAPQQRRCSSQAICSLSALVRTER
jgi:hypothetical protein